MPCQWIEVDSFWRFVTAIVTGSPSRNRSVGPGIEPFTAVARRERPVMFTGIVSMVNSNSLPESTAGIRVWEAVIERLALYLAPYIGELRELQTQGEVPIRTRIETGFRQLISAVCEEPESGMLISRISAERGEKLDMLVEKLVRPYHDAFEPLLLEAIREKLIAEQPLEMLYFMLLHAVTMSVSFRHVLGYFDEPYEDIDRLKRDMTRCVLATFLEKPPNNLSSRRKLQKRSSSAVNKSTSG